MFFNMFMGNMNMQHQRFERRQRPQPPPEPENKFVGFIRTAFILLVIVLMLNPRIFESTPPVSLHADSHYSHQLTGKTLLTQYFVSQEDYKEAQRDHRKREELDRAADLLLLRRLQSECAQRENEY
jgi:hypothetical protein